MQQFFLNIEKESNTIIKQDQSRDLKIYMNGWPCNMKEFEGSTAHKDDDIIVLTVHVKNSIDIAISRDCCIIIKQKDLRYT
jgi:hypothetical protein